MKTLSILFWALSFFLFSSGQVVHAEDGRATPYIGYSWPFEGVDLAQKFGNGPVILEMFTDQGCEFCPPADLFLNDLIRKTNVTALAYHVTLGRPKDPDPLSTKDGYDLQNSYSVILRIPRLTPQIVINGHSMAKGHMYREVLDAISARTPVLSFEIKKGEKKNDYFVSLPAMPLNGVIEGFDDRVKVRLVEYLKPKRSPISAGPNQGMDIEYLHIVSRVVPLPPWFGKAMDYKFDWTPSKEAGGAVLIFERQDTSMVGFAEIKL